MSSETLKATADKLLEHVRSNTTKAGLDELYATDAVSVEAMAMPGSDSAETRGVAGIRGKHDWWENTMEVHSASADGPFLHGDDRFAVIFAVEGVGKTDGKPFAMREVAVYSVSNGLIVREKFFYA